MTLRHILLASTVSALTISSPASACEFDGLPGFGGYHRMNPFAKAQSEFNTPRPVLEPQKKAEQSENAKNKSTSSKKTDSRKGNVKAVDSMSRRELKFEPRTDAIGAESGSALT